MATEAKPRPSTGPFATIEEAIEDVRQGKFVIVVDAADRENEGDLTIAAQFATPEAINFMATHARGLICLSLTEERCDELGLDLTSLQLGHVTGGAYLPGLRAWYADRGLVVLQSYGTADLGLIAYESTAREGLILDEGIRPWGNPLGAEQFGASFFMITGFHGMHVSAGVIYLVIVALKVWRGDYERSGNYEIVEIAGLYWHFVDLVWVFIFAFFYLW